MGTIPSGICCNREMAAEDFERSLLLDAIGERFLSAPRPISREPYGSGSIAGFETSEPASVAFGDESATGDARTTWFVDTSGRRVDRETGLVLGDPERPDARIWLHPADPRLPALAPASFEHSARVLLERVGIELTAPPELIAYRAGKRAVFRMLGAESTTYIKVVRPAIVAELTRVHTALRDAGLPVPRVIAWGDIGLLVIATAEGDALTSQLGDIAPETLLDGIDQMRDRLGSVALGRPARASLTQRSDWYVERLQSAATNPELAADVAAAVAALDERVAPRESRTVHGDLHCGQLFVRDAQITGLIDVDTAGTGDPTDDEAAFIGHLLATAAMRDASGYASESARVLALAAWQRWSANAPTLRYHTVVHGLGHALLPALRGDVSLASGILRGTLDLVRA